MNIREKSLTATFGHEQSREFYRRRLTVEILSCFHVVNIQSIYVPEVYDCVCCRLISRKWSNMEGIRTNGDEESLST